MDFAGNTWAEVDMGALVQNFKLVRQLFGAGRSIFSVVKTDAYGHGTVPVARALEQAGSDGFSVSSLLEAEELRAAGIRAPILILGYTPPEFALRLARGNIHQCVYALDYARELDAQAKKDRVTLSCHLKLDTGMGRIGFDCRSPEAPGLDEAKQVLELDHLSVAGVFMHFATADSLEEPAVTFAQGQAARFWQAVEALEQTGHSFTYKHCCNSAATLLQEPRGNAIRPGILLYGLSPLEGPLPEGFRPVMSLYTTVSQVKTMAGGQSVSYGRTYVTPGQRRIATVCAGYGDGVPRLLSGQGHVLIRGQRAPIVGRVCMDQFCVDVTDIPDAARGDTVTVFGPGLPVSQVAAWARTIHYEVLCGITKRVKRIYKD